ncbi:hypothetical protein BC938DRAFT_481086 [Jimgerdemannia flammicorona]|uniref:Uncharacterized protein n=1 Tax=Jimgerdemannia flammicorona TaxID=994334 RepID=A0A433QGV8_9FUNG|nr:hypothetical protein BC938DRAFT_481086 [Jimgerdemannia flammicorona]
MEALAETQVSQVKHLTSTLRSLHKEISQLELNRMDIGWKVRKSPWDPGSDGYRELKEIRQDIAVKWLEAIKLEKTLARARSSLYSLNKALRTKLTASAMTTTYTTSENKIKEDNIEFMDLLPAIIRHYSSGRKIVFAGTDPGTVVTSTMIPRTLDEIINRFQAISTEGVSNTEATPYSFSVERLPKPNKITANLINNVTFLKSHQKKHQQRQKSNVDGVTQQKKLAKESREREIRTKRAYDKLTAQERRRIRAHAPPYQQALKTFESEHPDTAAATSQLPSGKQTPAVIHCIGHWQGINSTIKGHCRRGMKKIREQHRVYGHVGITNEYNTSKTCPFCFSRVVLHRTRRTIDGRKQVVRLNGTIECVHPRCPARRINHTTRGRDASAAANIALSGASVVLAADCQPLPPFRRDANHTRYNLANELLSVVTPELVPRDSI